MSSPSNQAEPQESQLVAVLHALSGELSDDGHEDEGFDVIDHWERDRSGTAFYHMVGRPSGTEVLVKTGEGWNPAEAELLYRAMIDLADIVSSSGIERAAVIRPVGWAGSPPAIVMPYVSGTDLVTLLRDDGRHEWAHMGSWMHCAGAMLAAYHRPHVEPSASDDSADEVRATGRQMRIPAPRIDRLLERVDRRGGRARTFGDFGPGILLGTADGHLYLLDPPERPSTNLIHKDIGNFMFEMRRQLAGHGFTRSQPVRGRFHELRARFLEGYSDGSGRGVDDCDQAMIALFEMRRGVGMTRKRLPRRPGDAAWFARSAIARRREVILSDCGHS